VTTAPLDPAAVRLALAPLGEARLLPAAAYLDDAVLDWERRQVFGGWMCVGRSSEVPERGLAAESLGDYGVLLTRDADGTLRAFENACRHRGHELLPCGGRASGRAVTCPYHAWSYRLDGSLIAAPGFKGTGVELDTSAFGLIPMRSAEWHGWVFVDRSGTAGPLEEHFADLTPIVEPYDPASLVTTTTHSYDVAANWKVVIENYQECYHCPMIHPELCQVSPPDSGDNVAPGGSWVGGSMDLRPEAQTMSLDGRSRGVVIARLDEHERRTVMYVAVLPNLLVSLHPDYVMSHRLTPLSPGLTRIECSWAFPTEAVAAEGFDPAYAVDFWDITNRQDWAACESVQRGLATPHYEPGPITPGEDGVYQFTTWMARTYLS